MAGNTTNDVAYRPITVAERKKAEELIKAKFHNLEESIKNEVQDKLAELKVDWQRTAGVDKLLAKIAQKEAEIAALRKQLKKVTKDEYYGRGYHNHDDAPSMTGGYAVAKRKLEQAKRHALENLASKRCEVVEQLWFGILSKDALALVEGVPTVKQLKSNGLAVLDMPVKKLIKG